MMIHWKELYQFGNNGWNSKHTWRGFWSIENFVVIVLNIKKACIPCNMDSLVVQFEDM